MTLSSMMPSVIKETSRGFDCVRIEDTLFQNREIFLTRPVDAASMDALTKQLLYLSREEPQKEITLYINSPGGDVQSGLAAFDMMKLIKTPIKTVCLGNAASMGAILFLAGDKREMFPNSRIMIHDPSHGGGSMAGMKPDELDERVRDLKKVRKILCGIIAEATGKSESAVRAKTRKDSYFNAEEAVEYGLATGIVTSL